MKKKRYSDYNSYLRSVFGQRVQKISLDAGLSCPNRDGRISRGGCIYCNSEGSGTGAHGRGMTIQEQLEAGRIPMIKKYKAGKFMAYFQSYTNTYASCARLKKIYDEALSCADVVGMAIGTRPDCIDPEKLDLIQSYTDRYMVWLEYGLQTVHDATLEFINRGHDFRTFETAVQLTQNRGIRICAHVILGLPNEDREMMLHTAKVLAGMGIDGIKIHLLYVVKGTPLDILWQKGGYTCMTREEYVETVCDFLELLPEEMIIQRITGDPHPEELRSPSWALRYRETFNLIQKRLEERDTWQGRCFNGTPSLFQGAR